MNVTKLAQEIEKSRRFASKAEVFVVRKNAPPLKVEKIRTKGDMVLLYVEEDEAPTDLPSFSEG